MVAGQVVLAVCPAASELAETVKRHDAGWVVEPGHSAELAAVLRQAAGDAADVLRRRRNAFRHGNETYTKTSLKDRWWTLLTSVIAGAAAKRGR